MRKASNDGAWNKSQRVRREIEHIRRDVTRQQMQHRLFLPKFCEWLHEVYYDGDNGKTPLEEFLSAHPWNAETVRDYVSKERNRLRLTIKTPKSD